VRTTSFRMSHTIKGRGRMQSTLQIKCLSEADASAYYTLRRRSLEGLRHPAEPEVLRELGNGISGLVERLARYEAEGTRAWGVFDQRTLAGAAAATHDPLRGDGLAKLWGVFVVPRYRGTAVSRLLMDALFACCEQAWNVRTVSSTFTSGNRHALQFLRRFGFDLSDSRQESNSGTTCTMVRVCRD
jgi:GNAT superfamily N-acetyltransferase